LGLLLSFSAATPSSRLIKATGRRSRQRLVST